MDARPLKDKLDSLGVPGRYAPGPRQYYEDLPEGERQACDWILRCDEQDCRTLVTLAEIHRTGGCPRCGSHTVKEVRTLSFLEWLKIRLGVLDFPHRDKFLAAFPMPWARAGAK